MLLNLFQRSAFYVADNTMQSLTKPKPAHFTQHSCYPWVVILICASFLFYKYILQVSPNIMSDALMREFHVSGAGLGLLAATFFFAYFITQLFVGVLLDKMSLRWLSGFALFASGLGGLWFARSHHLIDAELFRSVMGFGAAFATVCYLKAAAIWFPPRRFAFVSGLLATAAMLGAVFGEAPLAYVVAHQGWRQTLIYCGWLGVILAVLFIAVVRDEPKVNFVPLSAQDCVRIRWQDVACVLLKRQNWLLAFYSGMTFSPIAVLGGLWGNMYLKEAFHINNTHAASLLSFSFIGLAAGGPTLGALSDLLGRRKMIMVLGNVLGFIGLVPVLYLPGLPLWSVGSLLFVFGFGVGGFMLGFTLGKEINDIAVAATVIALINSGDAIFGAITEPLVGKLLDWGWHGKILSGVRHYSVATFQHAFLVMPLYILVATFLSYWIDETRGNQYSLDED